MQSADAVFVGADDGRHVCIGDAIQELIDLRADLRQFLLQGAGVRFARAQPLIPQRLEHGPRNAEQVLCGPEALQQGFKLAFDDIALDRLAVARAALLLAEIVRIPRRAARRPTGGQRHVAIAARHRAAQGKVFAQVLAGWRSRSFGQTLLDFLIRLKADQSFVMALAQRHVPFGRFDMPRIKHAGQDVGDTLAMHMAVAVARKGRVRFKKTLDFRLQLKMPRGIEFKAFLNDRGHRLVPHHHLVVPGNALVAVADGSLKYPVAVHHPRAHPVLGLLAVLLPLVLRDAGEEIFNEHRVRVFPKFDGGRLQHAPGAGNRGPQLQMGFQPSRQTRNVIDDDDMGFAPMLAQIAQHGFHPRPVDQAARHVVLEGADDLIALVLCKFAAASLLRIQAVAFCLLSGVRHPAVDDGLVCAFLIHARSPSGD